MKYIKTYENVSVPKIGDYVIGYSLDNSDETIEFLKNNIGQIIGKRHIKPEHYSTDTSLQSRFEYKVEYKGVIHKNSDFIYLMPNNFSKVTQTYIWFNEKEINHFSKNEEDLYVYIDSNKYNL